MPSIRLICALLALGLPVVVAASSEAGTIPTTGKALLSLRSVDGKQQLVVDPDPEITAMRVDLAFDPTKVLWFDDPEDSGFEGIFPYFRVRSSDPEFGDPAFNGDPFVDMEPEDEEVPDGFWVVREMFVKKGFFETDGGPSLQSAHVDTMDVFFTNISAEASAFFRVFAGPTSFVRYFDPNDGMEHTVLPPNILSASLMVPTPEPGTLTLCGVGLVGMIGYRWRRRQRSA